uniref:Solute carrier family 5 member 8 n=1 Tax=Cyclopterus lumpus TaxID=8103 RepID=A0A8C3AS36_CYCLU
MSGDSLAAGSFVAADYAVFALMLLVSAAVGVYHAWMDRGQASLGDFLMGGRRLTALPVSLSLTASFMSAITVLSNPAEVYLYGASIGFYGLSYVMAMVVTSEFFLPVFYRLAITSTYEYLELRFSRATRLLGTMLFIVQTILYTGIVIYVPALALNQVTGMDLWGAIISTGVVCTFYCTMVQATQMIQMCPLQLGVMLAGFLSVIIRSVIVQGGVLPVISDSQIFGLDGSIQRWEIFKGFVAERFSTNCFMFLFHDSFDTNPLRRHTFWTITIGGTFVWVSIYGINQAQVQRYISCKSITHARLSLYINLVGLCAILLCSVFAGMCLFSVYKECDPWTAGLVSAPDQLMPYLVMDILGDYPGLPGLFVAAAYSGSLSTVSSSINALAAVTVEDLIKPYTNMSERHLARISKGLSLLYGVVCIGMAGLASLMGGILQATISIFGIIGGPLLGVFTLGIFCPFANSKGALSGLVSGLVLSLWVGIGAQIYPPPPEMSRPLSLTTEGCNFTATDSLNWTSTALPTHPLLADSWYSLSYLYFSPIGTIITVSVGLLVSLLTGTQHILLLQQSADFLLCPLPFIEVTRRTGEFDLTRDREEKAGSTNPAFCDVELDLTKGSVPT